MSAHVNTNISAEEALLKLQEGNKKYFDATVPSGDISPAKRKDTYENGQHPYAIIVTCSDSRVIPEDIFPAGIGELFIIRVAGNIINDAHLGSIEYAAEHLGCNLVVVLGHTNCGAIGAAISGGEKGFIKIITDEIKAAIGTESDDYRACCLNVEYSIKKIEENIHIPRLKTVGAVYHMEDGHVEFLE